MIYFVEQSKTKADSMFVFINLQQFMGSLFAALLLMKFGRKYLLQTGNKVIGVCLLAICLGLYIPSPAIVNLSQFVYMSAFGLSFGSIFWLYIPEIVEPKMIAVCACCNWSSYFLVTLLA